MENGERRKFRDEAPESRSKGRWFDSRQEQRENFLLRGQLPVLMVDEALYNSPLLFVLLLNNNYDKQQSTDHVKSAVLSANLANHPELQSDHLGHGG